MSDKRFFRLAEDDCVYYFIVARDLEHAKTIIRDTQIEFGDPGLTLDQASGLAWSELTPEQIAKLTKCHTEDDRGVIALADADLGDWFCSEW